MDQDTDISQLQDWVGRTETVRDEINRRLVRSFAAMFNDEPAARIGDTVRQPGIHWCLAPATPPARGIGPDGHPARGGFLPPVPLERRMVAGGRLAFHDAFRLGDAVERVSTIRSITMKEGRSGPLCFVVVGHEFRTDRGVAVVEEQDLVYRGASIATSKSAPAGTTAMPGGAWSERVQLSPVDLFRYSALTFNSHRIHYDQRYATEVEGYPGLLVHGTLQAILLLRLAQRIGPGEAVTRFGFRAMAPLFDTTAFSVNGDRDGARLKLWIASDASRHMEAEAELSATAS